MLLTQTSDARHRLYQAQCGLVQLETTTRDHIFVAITSVESNLLKNLNFHL